MRESYSCNERWLAVNGFFDLAFTFLVRAALITVHYGKNYFLFFFFFLLLFTQLKEVVT